MQEIYLDNSATTRVFPEVAALMGTIMCETYGNASSMHNMGVAAERYLKEAKETFAKLLKVNEKEIYFTSGGTESDNMAIIGAARAYARSGKHLITTKIEHPAVLETMRYLATEGYEVTYLGVDESGRIRLSDLEAALREDTILVSIMQVNNEVGSLQPIAEAGALIKKKNPKTLFHVDAVQGFGKLKVYPKRMNIDLLTASGHKIHGPKGIGLLYVSEKVRLVPICFGGGQQNGLRSGTENVPGMAGMALAARMLYKKIDEDTERLYALKEQFVRGLFKMDGVIVQGLPKDKDIRQTAPHVISVSVPGVRAEVLLHTLEEFGIYVSAGSACSTHKRTPSATLQALGLDKSLLDATVRFSCSVFTTQEEIEYTLQIMSEKIPMLRRYSRH